MSRGTCLKGWGFTLIEMLIAVALVAALAMILLPVAARIVGSIAAASDRGHRLAQVAMLSEMLDRAMLTAVASDASGAPGFVGERDSLRIASSGVSLTLRGPGEPDDVQMVQIRLATGAIHATASGGVSETMVPGVRRIEFAYASGEGWAETHDGSGGLPRAVAVSIWFGQSADESEEPGTPETGSETDPDWRRVFAVFDPGAGEEAAP